MVKADQRTAPLRIFCLLVVAGVDSWRGASAGMSKSPPTDLRITCDQKTYIKLASTLLAV